MPVSRRYAYAAVRFISIIALLPVSLLLGCDAMEPSLEYPARIVTYLNGVESIYVMGEEGYSTLFDKVGGTCLDNVLERAVDEEIDFKEGEYIVFLYDELQSINRDFSGVDSVSRIYDELVFCFSGPYAGEVVLGLYGQYASGTYKMAISA